MIGSRISKRYAKALLSLGQEDGNYIAYGKDLNEFGAFCSANREFIKVIANQIFSVEERKRVLDAVLAKSPFADLTKNFLRLLLDKNRIGGIQGIVAYYSKLTDEISNITRADIITAKPLKKEARDKLAVALEGLTAKEVKIEVREDASLIGGLVVRIGDLVLDGSVKAQLEGLKESLKRGEYN
ncbi:MAG: F-type H+-transporting ATPase subunit delta [Thermodesulfobacteriota bacterium]|nr:F-type H+-transporting ATPase subunit delta [Thermodesulfobacteriota bacterium]